MPISIAVIFLKGEMTSVCDNGRNTKLCALLVGMWGGAATVESSMEVLQKN